MFINAFSLSVCMWSVPLFIVTLAVLDTAVFDHCVSLTFPPPLTSKIPSSLSVFLILWLSFFHVTFPLPAPKIKVFLSVTSSIVFHSDVPEDVIYHLNSALTRKWAILTLLNTIPLGLPTGVSSWICSG